MRSPSATRRSTMAGTSSRVAPSKRCVPACRLDLDAARARQLVRAALGQQLAVVDDRHAVAHALDLAEQVGVEQHGDAAPAQLGQQVAHDPPPDRDPARSSARRAAAGAGRRPAPARSPGAAACPSTSPRRGARPRRRARPAPAARRARPAPPVEPDRRWCRCSSSSARRPAGEAEELGQVAERAARGRRAGRGAAHAHGPRRRAHEARRALDQRRLARAVGAQQADELGLADGQVDPAQRGGGAVALGQAPDLERGRHERRRTIAAPPRAGWAGAAARRLVRAPGLRALGDVRRRRLDRPGLHDAAVTYDPPVAVRLAIVAVAAAAIVLLGSRLRDHDRCDSARAAVATHVGALTSSCRDPDVVAGASAQLLAAGKRDAGAAAGARERAPRAGRASSAGSPWGWRCATAIPPGRGARWRAPRRSTRAGRDCSRRLALGRRSGRRAAAVLEAQDRALDEVVAGRRDRQRHRAEREEQADERRSRG